MDNVSSDNNKRIYQRLKINITAALEVNKPLLVRGWLGNEEVEAVILDLSEGGVAISTNQYIPISAQLSIAFMLYKTGKAYNFKLYKTIKAKGEVKSNIFLEENKYRLGICFKQIDDEDKYAIANFVKKYNNPH